MKRTPRKHRPGTADQSDKSHRTTLRAVASVILLVLLIAAGSLCVPNFHVDDIRSVSSTYEGPSQGAPLVSWRKPRWSSLRSGNHVSPPPSLDGVARGAPTRPLAARAFKCLDPPRTRRSPGVRPPPGPRGCHTKATTFHNPMTHRSMETATWHITDDAISLAAPNA
jgi:hypothetical protein